VGGPSQRPLPLTLVGLVGLVSTVEPVVTVALGAVFLGEPITVFVIAGGVLVLGGVLFIHAERGEPGRITEAPALSDHEK
jgi:drug/metabolite transporter (DMT)-like permease